MEPSPHFPLIWKEQSNFRFRLNELEQNRNHYFLSAQVQCMNHCCPNASVKNSWGLSVRERSSLLSRIWLVWNIPCCQMPLCCSC